MGGGPLDCEEVQRFSFFELSTGWSFRQTDSQTTSWHPVRKIPSTIHQDLVDNGVLDDPLIGFNELKAEWVGTKSWTYRTQFHALLRSHQSKAELVFDGLDTFAEIRLDGNVILTSNNMFISNRVDITEALKHEKQHHLEIKFDSALLKAREIARNHPDHKWRCWNGESARLAVRKAQYHWGWDWGPSLMCAGIWKPVRLEIYTARIIETSTKVSVASDHRSATVCVDVRVENCHKVDLEAKFKISLAGETISEFSDPVSSNGCASAFFSVDMPSLWMPSGYGSQHLYDVEVKLSSHKMELHSDALRIGLRKVELAQEQDNHGKSFFFRINGVDIFCGGSCWIPADSFLTNITPERYRAWIELAVSTNQQMIRVWGGGIYEHDSFYAACDELGILVWQDFMFACGNYPCNPSFLASVKTEATQNVRRLRHHPSIVIFAGNNEDYQIAEVEGLVYDYADKNTDNWLKTDFPARYIYESLLPEIVRRESDEIPYHPGSPWSEGEKTSDPTVGDIHQWNVWHGTQEKYQTYPSLGGRFNSEFGMEALPHLETIKAFAEGESDLYPQSRIMDFHNKAAGHERRMATYLFENVRIATELEPHIYLTQLIQSEALCYAYRGWRRQWGDDRKCGGALAWQLNDCWPTISWSMCDYYLRKKPACYTVARCLAPIAVGVLREHWDWSVSHAREPANVGWEVWGVTSRLEGIKVDVEIRFWSIESGEEIEDSILRRGVELTPNSSTEIARGVVDNMKHAPHVIAVKMWMGGVVIARCMDWPQPLKYLRFPKRNIKIKMQGEKMQVLAEKPVKCLLFEERDGCVLSDNALDLAPSDEQVIIVKGFKEQDLQLKWTYLDKE